MFAAHLQSITMKYVKIALRVVLLFFAIVFIAFVIVVSFSAKETRFSCVGSIKMAEQADGLTIYVKLEEYRPWVGLWSDSAGSLSVEIPNNNFQYYNHIDVLVDQLRISNVGYSEGKKEKDIAGYFSMLSKMLSLKLYIVAEGKNGFFDGKCQEIQ